jgi:hypothetical protein
MIKMYIAGSDHGSPVNNDQTNVPYVPVTYNSGPEVNSASIRNVHQEYPQG